MSFQHFRLGELAMAQPLPPHLLHHPQGTSANAEASTSSSNADPSSAALNSSKAPYGSGDSDDGYTLVFPNIEAFHAWRMREEEAQMVEFVKGDTHGSKAVPPRFKDHTKLVCARHSRSGRKKYVKKHPERVRKVPSRKLEGQGCPASISYKTYFHTEEVRACYISQHSHEIGLANLPFTRRGRRAAVQNEKERSKQKTDNESSVTPSPVAGPPSQLPPQPMHGYGPPMMGTMPRTYSSQPNSQPYTQPPPMPQSLPPTSSSLSPTHERWDRMAVLFSSIRDNARSFEYPGPSVVALESVLIRLYLESPVSQISQPPGAAPMMPIMPAQSTSNGTNSAANGVLNGNGLSGASSNGVMSGTDDT